MALKPVGARLTLEDGGFFSGMKRANDAVKGFGDSAKGVSASTVALGTAMGNLAASGIKAVASAFVDAGKAAAGFVAGSVSMAADLEAQMSGIAAVLGASNEELAELKGLVVNLGIDPNLKVSSIEAAQAIEVLAKNGLNMQQIMDGAARNTVFLANATGADFATAADVATDVMAQFNISAENMGTAVDGISGVLTNSKFGINDYRLAIANAGAIAADTGLSFEEFNTILVATSSSFASGSDAGTSLKTMLQRLSNPTNEMADLMAELGISLFDANGNTRQMSDVVQALSQAFGGMTQAQQAAVKAQLGGADASRILIGLNKLNAEQFQALSDKVNAQGQASDAAATRVNNLRGALDILGGIVEAIRLEIGGAFLPVITELTKSLSSFVEANSGPIIAFFQQFAAGVQQFVSAVSSGQGPIDAFFTALQSAGVDTTGLQTLVNNVISLSNAAMSFASENGPALTGALAGIGAVLAGAAIAAGIAAIGTALAALLSPIGLLVTGAAALGAAWNSNFGGIQEKTMAVWGLIQPVFEQLVSWFQTNIPTAVQAATDVFNNSILPAFQTIGAFISSNLPTWQATFLTVWETIKAAVTAAVDTIVQTAWPPLQAAFASITEALNTLGLDWSDVWGALGEATGMVVTVIGAAILSIVPIFVGLVTGIAEGAANIASTLSAMATTFQSILDHIAGYVIAAGQVWQRVIKGDFAGAAEAWARMMQEMEALSQNTWTLITQVFQLTIGTIIDFVGGFVKGVVGWFENMARELVGASIVPDMAAAIIEVFFNMGDKVVEAVKAMGDRAVSTLKGYISQFADVGRAIVDGLVGAIKNGAGAVGDAVRGLAESAVSKAKSALGIESPSKVFFEIGENIGEGLLQGILSKEDYVIKNLIEMGNKLAGFASTFGGFFTKNTLDPMKNALDDTNKSVSEIEGKVGEAFGIDAADVAGSVPALFLRLAKQLNSGIKAKFDPMTGEWTQEAQDLTEEQVRLLQILQGSYNAASQANAAYNAEQERLLRLQEAQAKLDFLKTQRELINLISDNGLDAASILGGLELGINADQGAVIDALVRATEAMVTAAEERLQISSPSKVFAKIGQQTMMGLAEGVMGAARLPQMAVVGAEQRMIRPPASAQTINNRTMNNSFNMNVSNGMDQAMLVRLIQQTVANAI